MKPSHYVDVLIRETGISRELHARLLSAVHFQILGGAQLGVTWPDWDEKRASFGMLMRVFGTPAALASYLGTVEPLKQAELIRLFTVQPVPETATRVAFCRNRTIDKFAPSREARRHRRAAARGETAAPTSETRPDKAPHFLMLKSTTTGQAFAMHIRRVAADALSNGGNQYGLGHALPDF